MTVAVRIGSRYVAQSVIGHGSFGTVFRADGPDGPVAVKLLRPEYAGDREVVDRFLRERSVLLSLRHDNVVAVRDLVCEGDVLALVMDLIDGPNLRAYLGEAESLPAAGAAALAAEVARALAHAHAHGVVHRDIKPENVLLRRAGVSVSPLLTDFGVARLVSGAGLTDPGTVLGTPAYLAPEVASGQPVTAAADVYACGILLYELLTGRAPFLGDHPLTVVHRHVTEEPRRPAGISEDLWGVLAQCLAKDPARRPDASAVAGRLAGMAWRPAARPGPGGLAATDADRAGQATLVARPAGATVVAAPVSPAAVPVHRTAVMPGGAPISGVPVSGGPGRHGAGRATVQPPRPRPAEPVDAWPGPEERTRGRLLTAAAMAGVAIVSLGVGVAIGFASAPKTATARPFAAHAAASTKPSAPPTAAARYLTDLPLAHIANGYGPIELDRSIGGPGYGDGQPLTLGGQQYAKGLGVHAPSQVRAFPAGRCTTFKAVVGVDNEVAAAGGSVDFQVVADGKPVYDSGIVRNTDAPKPVQVDVTGAQVIDLVVSDGGDGNANDHADWADAQLVCTP